MQRKSLKCTCNDDQGSIGGVGQTSAVSSKVEGRETLVTEDNKDKGEREIEADTRLKM
jgi:hypothetical protein